MLRWSAAKSSSVARTAASWATRGSSRRRASSTQATSPRRILERWRTSSTGTTSVATNIPPPGPRRTVSRPASTSTAIASRSVGRLISICAASARSPGSLSPTRSSPARTFSAICSAASSNVRRVRTGSNIARAVYARWSARWTSARHWRCRLNARVCSAPMRRLGLALLLALTVAPAARADGPPPLSAETGRADIASTHGSGAFGTWRVDEHGLPTYRYGIDEETARFAPQPELAGNRSAWHQVGNDHIVADAYNHGYVELWSQ